MYTEDSPTNAFDPNGKNAVWAIYRAGRFGWQIGEAINPCVQPIIADAIDSIFLAQNNSTATQQVQQAKARQDEYWRIKQDCDKPPQPTGNECKDLSDQTDHYQNCAKWYEWWDNKWLPGRHATKIANWINRAENLKKIHNKKCTQECP